MMRSLLFLFLCVALSSVRPAVILIDQVEIPGHEKQCYSETTKIFYNKGEIIKNEKTECVQRKCLGFLNETGKLRIELLTCPKVEAGLGCEIVEDQSKPYPDCCPRLVSKQCKTERSEHM